MFKYKLILRLLKIVPKWLRNSSHKRLRALLKFYIKGNQLIIIRPDGTKLINPIHDYKFLRLTASGDCTNNTVIAYENQINGTNLDFNFFNGANNVFKLGKNNMIGMAAYIQGYNGHARIGDNNYICGSTLYLYCSGKTEFSIGNGNLFSSGITLWGGKGIVSLIRKLVK